MIGGRIGGWFGKGLEGKGIGGGGAKTFTQILKLSKGKKN